MTLSVSITKQRGAFLLDASFELPTPGVVALFGRSGCGKSTAIDIIAGLLRADRGQITLDGETFLDSEHRIDLAAESRGVGYVFQDARLFPHLTVEENLRYAEKRVRKAASRQVGGVITRPAVLELLQLGGLRTKRNHQLSGGERQRVAIGRALLSQPRLLLLDEPLASLDAARRDEVLPYLESLRDHLAIPMIYVSHNFDEVLRLATHIVMMDSGRTIAQGETGSMSLNPALRAIIGADAVGAIIDGVVLGREDSTGLMRVQVGRGELKVQAADVPTGSTLRVQLLARDLIVATRAPQYLSVRNALSGVIATMTHDDADTDMVSIDIGGALLMSRVTKDASRELSLAPGLSVWILVKAVSLHARAFHAHIARG